MLRGHKWRARRVANVIGLVGLAKSGKSEVAKLLMARGYRRAPFARPLKDMLRSLGLSEDQVDGDLKEIPVDELFGLTPRHLMRTIGTEWGRSQHTDFWVAVWRMRNLTGSHEMIVADDVRFPNEVAAIHALGGEVWHIDRPGITPMSMPRPTRFGRMLERAGILPAYVHPSERPTLLRRDRVICNDGTLSDLCRAAAEAVEEFERRHSFCA